MKLRKEDEKKGEREREKKNSKKTKLLKKIKSFHQFAKFLPKRKAAILSLVSTPNLQRVQNLIITPFAFPSLGEREKKKIPSEKGSSKTSLPDPTKRRK